MGNGLRKLNVCFAGNAGEISRRHHDIAVYLTDPLDEGLGHSFCYIRPELSSRVLSVSDEFAISTSTSTTTTTFRSISGASVSANTSTPLSTALIDLCPYNSPLDKASSFESSDLFASIPLQPIPRNSTSSVLSGPITRSSGVASGSGPIERGFLSGPMERSFISGPLETQCDQFQRYRPKSKKRALMRILKRAVPRPLVLPNRSSRVSNWVNGSGKNSDKGCNDDIDESNECTGSQNIQWAQGKAGEDRVHIAISEEKEWVFVGIYDGFNGPDATDFLLNNLYSNVYKELKGILWNEDPEYLTEPIGKESDSFTNGNLVEETTVENDEFDQSRMRDQSIDDYSECIEQENSGLDCDGQRNTGKNPKKRPRGAAEKREERESKPNEEPKDSGLNGQMGIDHSDVLKALSEALRKTEEAYLAIADTMAMRNPELALMGSCVLVMLMKGEDVYLLNVGDSRAVLAQKAEPADISTGKGSKVMDDLETFNSDEVDSLLQLACRQLTTDHCTSVEEEVGRIKSEHPDDASAVINDRVKGSLKVTRAFGAGFLKQPNWNNALLEMFRIDYVGTSPYINCLPWLYHHRLGPRDRFLILSSDGLYQYFTNEEAVSGVEMFMTSFPEGDPAQHLVEEVLFRAAKKAGMDFYELLDIPQGDRRKYHDDVSIIIISFEGRIWRSYI